LDQEYELSAIFVECQETLRHAINVSSVNH